MLLNGTVQLSLKNFTDWTEWSISRRRHFIPQTMVKLSDLWKLVKMRWRWISSILRIDGKPPAFKLHNRQHRTLLSLLHPKNISKNYESAPRTRRFNINQGVYTTNFFTRRKICWRHNIKAIGSSYVFSEDTIIQMEGASQPDN